MSPPSQPSKVTRVNLCTWDLESHVVWDDPTHDAHLNKFEEDMINSWGNFEENSEDNYCSQDNLLLMVCPTWDVASLEKIMKINI